MRTFRFAAVSSFMIFALILGSAVSGAQAGNYLGEFCWQLEDDGKYIILRFAVTCVGDGHFLLNGKAITPSGDVIPIIGNGEIDGDKVYITGTAARSWETKTMIGGRAAILDLPGLNGTVEAINTIYDKTTEEIQTSYKSLPATFIPCPE